MVPWRPEPPAIGIQDVENVRHVASNQSVQSIISLNSELPEQLLRAVPLDICLQRWGLHFNKAERTQGFKLSETTEAIDAFLSHDWDTPGIGKFLALLLVFNAMPAFFGAAVVLVVLCGLLAVKMLPGGWPTATACIYIVFVVILLFWQRLRRVLSLCQMGVVPRVFLDKLCIAQHDDQLKRQGILGLGGFLSKSHELLILWSPKTFTRLWCTFELACFMREKKRRHIRFVPVSMAKLLFLAGTTNLCLWLLWLLWVIVEADGAFGTRHFELLAVAAAFLAPAFLGGVAVQTYFGIQHMEVWKRFGTCWHFVVYFVVCRFIVTSTWMFIEMFLSTNARIFCPSMASYGRSVSVQRSVLAAPLATDTLPQVTQFFAIVSKSLQHSSGGMVQTCRSIWAFLKFSSWFDVASPTPKKTRQNKRTG